MPASPHCSRRPLSDRGPLNKRDHIRSAGRVCPFRRNREPSDREDAPPVACPVFAPARSADPAKFQMLALASRPAVNLATVERRQENALPLKGTTSPSIPPLWSRPTDRGCARGVESMRTGVPLRADAGPFGVSHSICRHAPLLANASRRSNRVNSLGPRNESKFNPKSSILLFYIRYLMPK